MGSAGSILCWSDIRQQQLGDCNSIEHRGRAADALANAMAKLTGETKTEAVTRALRERLDRVRRARTKPRLADALDEIALHCSTPPTSDSCSADEIAGHDGNGLPR